jgi:hypothetical protein
LKSQNPVIKVKMTVPFFDGGVSVSKMLFSLADQSFKGIFIWESY